MAKKIKIPVKTFLTKADFQEFVENEKEWFYTRIIESIIDACVRNEKLAHVVEAKIEETFSTIEFTSDSSEWKRSLKLALSWFEKEEQYEKCALVFELLEKLEDYLDDEV